MTHRERDEELEAFLERRSELHGRLAQLDHTEPSPALDRIVLARAREAIRPSEPEPEYHPGSWGLPLALAATLVVGFTIVLHFARPGGEEHAARQALERPAQERATDGALHADVAAADSPPAPAPAAEVAASPPPAPAAEVAASPPAAPAVAAASAKAAPAETAPSAARIEAYAVRTSVARSGSGTTQDTDGTERPRDPAAWLAAIEALRARGEHAEAQREWQAFRAAYPRYPVKATAEPPKE